MKVKLKSKHELQAVYLVVANMAMKLAMPSDTYTLRINAHGGLALLSAWYAVDVTEINDPLAYAVMSEIMDNLQKAYGSQTITQP